MNLNHRIKDVIQDCNINFLIGSGLSAPYLSTLGDIENLLTQLNEKQLASDQDSIVRASLYKQYFDAAIVKNLELLKNDKEAEHAQEAYCSFVSIINSTLLRRKSTILSKEANIFTTNVDVFLEKALEDAGLEYNDGFNGRFVPCFNLRNFKKSRSKRSLHFDNSCELPVFNLLKLHGSLAWQLIDSDQVVFSARLTNVEDTRNTLISADDFLPIEKGITIEELIGLSRGKIPGSSVGPFMKAYEKMLIVNPTKEKFKHSLLNQTYYELLRMYSNELERENTVLFVMGFSFADEHIREVTLRAANSNPTLAIYVIAHTNAAKSEIQARLSTHGLTNRNVELIAPTQEKQAGEDDFKYTLANINTRLFGSLFVDEDSSNLSQT